MTIMTYIVKRENLRVYNLKIYLVTTSFFNNSFIIQSGILTKETKTLTLFKHQPMDTRAGHNLLSNKVT